MASKTADFFENGTSVQFEFVLSRYQEALQAKADSKNSKSDTLIKLDKWFQNELPKKIKSRGKEAHLTHDELVQTIKWKLARGKFRPRLKDLVTMNTPRLVIQETKKSLRNLFKRNDLEASMASLCTLKGVGPAMASAVLAAAAPETAPFMADECLLSMPDIEGIDYTMKEYMKYVEKTRACVERLNSSSQGQGNWTPHRVELAIWTHYVAYDLKPELLSDMPSRHTGLGAPNGAATESNGINGTATPLSEVSSTASESDSNSCPPPESLQETDAKFIPANPEAQFENADPVAEGTEEKDRAKSEENGGEEKIVEIGKVEAPESLSLEEKVIGIPPCNDLVESQEEKHTENSTEPNPEVEKAEEVRPKLVEPVADSGENKVHQTNGSINVESTKESTDSESTNDSVTPNDNNLAASFQSIDNSTKEEEEESSPPDYSEPLLPGKRPVEEEEEVEREVKKFKEDTTESSSSGVVGLPPVIHAGGD